MPAGMLLAMARPGFPFVRPARRFAGTALLAVLAVLAGCATGHTVIDVPAPPASPHAASIAEVLRISNVSDDRVFEAAPSEPDVPSLSEPVSAAAAAMCSRTVARGDVVLSERANLCDVVRMQVVAALSQAGYRVEDDYQTALDVDVHVLQLWFWVQPGLMSRTIRSRIVLDIIIGGSLPVTVVSETSQPGRALTQEAWENAVEAALDAWRKQAEADLRTVPKPPQ